MVFSFKKSRLMAVSMRSDFYECVNALFILISCGKQAIGLIAMLFAINIMNVKINPGKFMGK